MHALGPIGTRRKPKETTSINVSLYLPIELIERLDAWRARQYAPPSRTALIRQILWDFLEQQQKEEQ